eukprot:TRINITY_DN14811_c0_g1_i1.p1 TRINITY_DN14811_c0_g1~~TRINITY_DN14811_c0_g1_i1.p1  ORF type:complete len:131 (+),score=24.43 TRINITY_DN14811_c0_g1_i1:58-450(+)
MLRTCRVLSVGAEGTVRFTSHAAQSYQSLKAMPAMKVHPPLVMPEGPVSFTREEVAQRQQERAAAGQRGEHVPLLSELDTLTAWEAVMGKPATATEQFRNPITGENGGYAHLPEPTRYGDWEKGGRCFDF